MVDIITRAGKGSELSYAEADGNLTNLQTAVNLLLTTVFPIGVSAKPTIGTDGTPQVGETLTGQHGTYVNAVVTARAWLLGGTAISGATGATYIPTATGSLVYRETITGPAGMLVVDSDAVTIAGATVPQLTLPGALAFTTAASPGTLVTPIGNVPAGVAPTLTPNDGRLVIAGDATAGWKVVIGMTASAAGSIALTVSAVGASAATATVSVTNPASATITTPLSLSQPGASQRFFMATADRAGTWSKGAGADAASFTVDATTGIFTVVSGAVGDGSAALVRFLPLVFTPLDGTAAVQKTIAVILAPAAAPVSASYSYQAPLTGPAGTMLSSLPGWSLSDPSANNEPTLDGSGALVGGDPANGNWALLYQPAVPGNGMSVTFTLRRTDSDGDNHVRIFAGAAGAENGFLYDAQPQSALFGTSSADATLRQGEQGSTSLGGLGNANPAPRADGTADFTVARSWDGNSITLTLDTGAVRLSKTYDVTGRTLGAAFGIRGVGNYMPAMSPGTRIAAIRAFRAATYLTVTSAPAYTTGVAATYALTWAGNRPTGLQHRLSDPDGNPVTDWMTGDTTVNDDGTIRYVATAPRAGSFGATFRPLNDTPATTATSTPTRYLARIEPFQFGCNVSSACYYSPVPILTNWGKFVRISGNPGDGFGVVIVPYASINGDYSVTTDIGVTLSDTNLSDGMTVLESHSETGQHRIRVERDATPPFNARQFKWSGAPLTFFTVARDGHPEKIAPEWRDGIALTCGSWLRDLDMVGTNNVPLDPVPNTDVNKATDLIYKMVSDKGPYVPVEDLVDGLAAVAAVKPGGMNWWHTIRPDMSDAEVTAEAVYARDHFPPANRIALQLGNEDPWNGAFNGVNRLQLDGIAKGYWGDATAANPKPAKTLLPYVYGKGWDHGGHVPGNTDSPAAKAGDWIAYHFTGFTATGIWEAKQDVPAGVEIAENQYWHHRVDIDPVLAGRRWVTVRHDQIIEIWRAVFGEARFAAQIMPVRMGWSEMGELIADLVVERTFVPGYWDKIRGAGYAWYFSTPEGRDDAYHASLDTPAKMEAALREGMALGKARIQQMVADCIVLGVVPMLYEGLTHPASGNQVYMASWIAFFASAAGRSYIAEIVAWMKANVPGIVMCYDLVANSIWSIMADWNDTNNPRRLGVLDGLAS